MAKITNPEDHTELERHPNEKKNALTTEMVCAERRKKLAAEEARKGLKASIALLTGLGYSVRPPSIKSAKPEG